jgi:hypothetical protein
MPLRPQTLYPAHANQHPAVTGGNVAILSADNPRFPAEMQGEDALKTELDRLGLDYEVTKGRYGAPERSYIVTNPELPTILDLARRFGQESVAYSENGRHQLHFVNGPQAGMATTPSEKHQWHEQEPQDNYTAVPSPNGEPWGFFTWDIDFNSPMVPSAPTPMTQEQVAPMAKSESPLFDSIRGALEALGELRTRELAKSAAPVTDTDAYFHPSEKGSPPKPKPAGPPAQNTYRQVPKDYRKAEMREGSQVNIETNPFKKPDWKPIGTAMKSEYDAGSAVSMVQGDMTHVKSQHGSQEKQMAKTDKVDPLDGDIAKQKHMCKMCKAEMSPVVAALRAKKGGVCMKCGGDMAKAELKYDKNEPQHGQLDNSWKPKCEEPNKAPGSGGQVTRNPVGNGSNDGAASTTFPMKKAEVPAARPRSIVDVLRSKTLAKGSLEAKLGTGKTDHLAAGAPTGTNMPNPAPAPAPMAKAEGMPVPAAPKPPQAPGAKPTMAGGMAKAEDLQKTFTAGGRLKPSAGDPRGRPASPKPAPKPVDEEKWFAQGDIKKALHKALRETIDLHKADPGSLKAGLQQASFDAKPAPTGLPAAGKVQPKSPAEFDAASFRPASPGAAGAPSGLELDTKPKAFEQGFKPAGPAVGKGGPGMAPTGAGAKPGMTTLKGGIPIAKLTGIRGAPLSKPKV